MTARSGLTKYYAEGYSMLIGPGNWRPVTIYFKGTGNLVNIVGCDIWDKEKNYLGWVDPHNIGIEQRRMMQTWLREHKAKWVRIHI